MQTQFNNVIAACLLLASGTAALGQEPSDFFEQKRSYFLAETVEGASKHAEAPAETPATVTVIGREEIELYGFRTIADVLNFASIGYFAHNDRRYEFAGGRGLFFFEDFNTRILVMLNGHPLNEPWNNFGGIGREMLIPLDLAERVEIVYGPSSLLYGGYSLFGIVNVVTRTGSALAGTRLRAETGTPDTTAVSATWGAAGVGAGDRGAAWDVLVSAGYYSSGGEDLTLPLIDVEYGADPEGGTIWGGPQSGTDYERSPYSFVYAKRGGLSVMARSGSREHGGAMAPYQSIYGSADSFVKDEKHFVDLRWDRPLASGIAISTRLFRDWYRYEEHDPYFDDESYEESSLYDFVLIGDDVDTGAEVRLTVQRGAHFLTAGGEYRTRDITQTSFDHFPDGSVAPDGKTRDTFDGALKVLYVQEEWRPTNHWTLVAGGNLADTEPGGRKVQPRLAAIFKPRPDLSIKALYGTGFRAPSAYEAEYADFIDQIPNPVLTSEEIASAELSAIWVPRTGMAVQAYAFDSRLEGLIRATEIFDPSEVEGGVASPTGDPADLVGLIQYQSAGTVDSQGAGIGLRGRGQRLRGYANLAWSDATFAPHGGESFALPASSSWLGSAGLAWDAGAWAIGVSSRWVGSQPLDPNRETGGSAGSFFEANCRALWRTSAVYPLDVYLDLRNLLDDDGAVAASPIYTPDRIPIEGFRASIGAEIRF